MTSSKPFIYIDRRPGKPIERGIPSGVRVAIHLPGRDCLELHVDPNGCWRVQVGPELGESGEFRKLADGRLIKWER